ncbi:class I SAM-dependent methyltransferase [Edaphobacter sp. HDX4]|uniref:class I SAM-dependent methyltransferase n=1 Tax=Edaphobacter sp. HDX4 TaxID=2794064 RepID=UPI002FE61BFB
MGDFHYVGSELDVFAEARNWKSYWSGSIRRFLSGDILEVGAGIGSNTEVMCGQSGGRWVCLEPDPALVDRLRARLREMNGGSRFEDLCGTLRTMDKADQFDTIVYIDVLEHIEDDVEEMREAEARLRPGGRIVVLSPAHQWLYTPFDAAIGHFRRYNRMSLKRVSPAGMVLEKMFYLDACGIFASAANQMFLRQSTPTRSQIGAWDRWIIPASRVVDPMLGYAVGKSIIGIWRKPAA